MSRNIILLTLLTAAILCAGCSAADDTNTNTGAMNANSGSRPGQRHSF